MSRSIGSGSLSEAAQMEIFRAFMARKESTMGALAKRHNVSKSIIKGVLYRLRKKSRVVLETPDT